MATPAPVYRATVHFSGHVQGVGFRYQAYQTAKEFEVTGLVKNLSDGRVLLVAEGLEEEVQDFIETVRERMEGYIRDLETSSETGARQHGDFSIQ
ncbi:MAG: acylphosphatase [Puniceicoccaceae bacterium]|nr:MAG: acylphosphatase [Puniceicoccaceae bacterium]